MPRFDHTVAGSLIGHLVGALSGSAQVLPGDGVGGARRGGHEDPQIGAGQQGGGLGQVGDGVVMGDDDGQAGAVGGGDPGAGRGARGGCRCPYSCSACNPTWLPASPSRA